MTRKKVRIVIRYTFQANLKKKNFPTQFAARNVTSGLDSNTFAKIKKLVTILTFRAKETI